MAPPAINLRPPGFAGWAGRRAARAVDGSKAGGAGSAVAGKWAACGSRVSSCVRVN